MIWENPFGMLIDGSTYADQLYTEADEIVKLLVVAHTVPLQFNEPLEISVVLLWKVTLIFP